MTLTPTLAGAAIGYLLGLYMTPRVLRLLSAGGLERPNFQGERIPVGAGILFPLAILPTFVILLATDALVRPERGADGAAYADVAAAALVATGYALLGLLDDTVGDGGTRGLKGHLGALLRGELTTGGVKAAGGAVLALLAAWLAPLSGPLLLSALLICLGANTINLFDLRPGRALKVFFLGYACIALATASTGGMLLVLPAIAAAFLPYDLQARAMLGDTGANVLGGWLGLFLATHADAHLQWPALAFLAALHFYAEKRSLTTLIGNTPVLSWLDMLGRRR